jgi:asparagine synthase (glutamine-hydrolysing)
LNGIFGILNRDWRPVEVADLELMRGEMAPWGCEGGSMFRDGPYGGGMIFDTGDDGSGVVFAGAGRVYNRTELCAQLGCGGDVALMRLAWNRWGEDAPSRIFGDWAFSVWDPARRRLFLARDHTGNTALYYHAGPRVFAFSSSRRALLALRAAPCEPDELFLAQVLVGWSPRIDGRTSCKALRRLPPAHTLCVSHGEVELRQYWRLEDAPELSLPRPADYAEAFREVFDQAVRDRIREDPVASMLSGGLDSGSVTATAAQCIGQRGGRLAAFTSVPLFETAPYVAKTRFGDELPFARATAEAAGNVDLKTVDGANLSPVRAIARMLEIAMEPQHSAMNLFWMLEINRRAAAEGWRALLTGQMGNAGASWTGDVFSQPLGFQLRHLGIKRWFRGTARRRLLQGRLLRAVEGRRRRANLQYSGIRPEFAVRSEVFEQWAAVSPERAPHSPRAQRCRIVLQGLTRVGAIYAEMGAAQGIEIRDPTADPRLLTFSLSVPDRIFIDRKTGIDRWLIREAMKGRLPDSVRLNRLHGRQAGDIVPRLRASAGEVEDALSGISRGAGAAYVDVPKMRGVWNRVRTEDSVQVFQLASTVLMRGMMAGLFVNGFGGN